MSDIFDFLMEILLPTAVVLTVVLTPFALLVDYLDDRECRIFSETTGYETKRAAFSACYVRKGDRFYRYDEFKHIFLEEEAE